MAEENDQPGTPREPAQEAPAPAAPAPEAPASAPAASAPAPAPRGPASVPEASAAPAPEAPAAPAPEAPAAAGAGRARRWARSLPLQLAAAGLIGGLVGGGVVTAFGGMNGPHHHRGYYSRFGHDGRAWIDRLHEFGERRGVRPGNPWNPPGRPAPTAPAVSPTPLKSHS